MKAHPALFEGEREGRGSNVSNFREQKKREKRQISHFSGITSFVFKKTSCLQKYKIDFVETHIVLTNNCPEIDTPGSNRSQNSNHMRIWFWNLNANIIFDWISWLVVGVLRQYPWQRRYDCRSGSLPEILQYRVWPVSRTETFNTQVLWFDLQRRYRAQPSVRN